MGIGAVKYRCVCRARVGQFFVLPGRQATQCLGRSRQDAGRCLYAYGDDTSAAPVASLATAAGPPCLQPKVTV